MGIKCAKNVEISQRLKALHVISEIFQDAHLKWSSRYAIPECFVGIRFNCCTGVELNLFLRIFEVELVPHVDSGKTVCANSPRKAPVNHLCG